MALIYCSECGAQISDQASTCPNCGNPVKNAKAEKLCPNTDLGRSILVSFFCWPLAMPAILNASKVTTKFLQGDYESAARCSRKARKWSTFAIVSAVIFWMIYVVAMLAFILTEGVESLF